MNALALAKTNNTTHPPFFFLIIQSVTAIRLLSNQFFFYLMSRWSLEKQTKVRKISLSPWEKKKVILCWQNISIRPAWNQGPGAPGKCTVLHCILDTQQSHGGCELMPMWRFYWKGGGERKKSQRNPPLKEERYHMAVRARYTVSNFVHTLLLKHTHTFTVPIPPRFVSCAGLSLPSVSSCCCCSFLLSWENRGFFSLVSVFYRKYISASRYFALVPSVIPVRPAGTPPLQPQLQELRRKKTKNNKKNTIQLSLSSNTSPLLLSCYTVFSL